MRTRRARHTQKNRLELTLYLLVAWLGLFAAQGWAQACKIEIGNGPQHSIQYLSAEGNYQEAFENHQWVARSWGIANSKSSAWGHLPAFEIRVKTAPSPASVPGTLLSSWDYVAAQQVPATKPGDCHAVVELSSRQMPINVKLHTVLDGTPVLTRWIEVTNRSNKPLAISSLFPIAGQLWRGDAVADVGYSIRYDWQREGWFGWTRLKPGTNRIQQEHGLSFDHPYFLLRNETAGEYFFGELEWPLNRVMEFYDDHGESFEVGPTAANALYVLAPGEAVESPKIHLGHTRGSFDAAVQGMHDHIRKSVLYARNPDRAYRIELLMPEDWGLTLYRGDEFNQTNLEKIIDVIEQLGLELFIVDGPSWCKNYGDWLTPQPKEFPNGLKPLSDYAHSHHVLFGLYAEPEGGREASPPFQNGLAIGSWKNGQVFQQHPDWFPEVAKMSEPKALGPDDPRAWTPS